MRLLLDTHVFLWWITDDPRLSAKAKKLMSDKKNEIFFSVVSGWEIALKARLGRLTEVGDPGISVPQEIKRNRLTVMDLSLAASLHEFSLAPHHADPFDRMLVSQAITEGIDLISGDRQMAKYDVRVHW